MNTQTLAIIEAYCGQSFRPRQVNERIPLIENVGRLTHAPVISIDAIRVRCSGWVHAQVFGSTEWTDYSPDDASLKDNQLVVTGGVLNAHFTEADVSYTVGYAEIPAPVIDACQALETEIESFGGVNKSAYSLSALITPEIAEALAPFKLRGGVAR